MNRRDFLKSISLVGLSYSVLGKFDLSFGEEYIFPEKSKKLIIHASRPPLLETPVEYLKELITPNDAVFVRWHLSGIPTYIDMDEYRLKVYGNVEKPTEFTINDLIAKFEKVEYVAFMQCSGNGRSFFNPSAPGVQWKWGAMANIKWTGVRLKDILDFVGVKSGTIDIAFNGLDVPPMPTTPDVVKAIKYEELFDDIIVAYKMNDKPLPMLNGFPLRLIVPGWNASLWIKSLSEIIVLDKEFDGFWVKNAYRVPDNPCECINPGETPKHTKPAHRLKTNSVILEPQDNKIVKVGEKVKLMGVAYSGGYSINQVLVSIDGGRSWVEASLGKDLGKYSWIQWFYEFTPRKKGDYKILVQAKNSIGESQPFNQLWNPSGYFYNVVQTITVKAI